jgi:hypothetical protein
MELLETESMEGHRCENLESNNVREARNRLRRVALLVNLHPAAPKARLSPAQRQ